METECSLFFVLMILLASCGCIDTQNPVENDGMQNGTAEGLPVNSSFTPTSAATGGTEIPVDLSQIEIRCGQNFSPNVTLISSILRDDSRTGILIENGWNITSINEPLQSWDVVDPVQLEEWNVTSINEMNDRKDRARGSAAVEFQKEGLSFYIGVDEREGRTAGGYCGAEVWIAEPVSGPRPGDYHQARDKMEGWWHVFDDRNERVVMIYNSTTIFYLYPSYSIINMEGIQRSNIDVSEIPVATPELIQTNGSYITGIALGDERAQALIRHGGEPESIAVPFHSCPRNDPYCNRNPSLVIRYGEIQFAVTVDEAGGTVLGGSALVPSTLDPNKPFPTY
jgi:hypothetical protein